MKSKSRCKILIVHCAVDNNLACPANFVHTNQEKQMGYGHILSHVTGPRHHVWGSCALGQLQTVFGQFVKIVAVQAHSWYITGSNA